LTERCPNLCITQKWPAANFVQAVSPSPQKPPSGSNAPYVTDLFYDTGPARLKIKVTYADKLTDVESSTHSPFPSKLSPIDSPSVNNAASTSQNMANATAAPTSPNASTLPETNKTPQQNAESYRLSKENAIELSGED
jgi:hypothetical protein